MNLLTRTTQIKQSLLRRSTFFFIMNEKSCWFCRSCIFYSYYRCKSKHSMPTCQINAHYQLLKKPRNTCMSREKRKQRALGGNRGIFFLMYITVCIVNLLISTYTVSMISCIHSKDKGRAANCWIFHYWNVTTKFKRFIKSDNHVNILI